MTRTLRWKATPGWSRLSPRGRDVSLPRRWWSQQGLWRWWCPWLARNEPSLWADWQWRGLSHNCLPSNPLKLIDQWQNLLINLSSGEWAPARIVSLHRACGGLFSRPGSRRIPSRIPQSHGGALASSISGQPVLVFSQSWNNLLVGRCDAYWWAPFWWFLRHTGGPSGARHLWHSASRYCLVTQF